MEHTVVQVVANRVESTSVEQSFEHHRRHASFIDLASVATMVTGERA